MIEPGLPQETVLLYKLSVNKQLRGQHEQTHLLENIGCCFLLLSLALLFLSVPALQFRDYMHKVDMGSILLKRKKNKADFQFLCLYFYTHFGHFVKGVSNL